MKYILCVVCVSAVAILLASVDAGKDEENMLRQACADCISETGATDDDITAMAEKKLPTTKTGKCFTFCVLLQFSCINEGGEFQPDTFIDLMKMSSDDVKLIEAIEKVSKECVGTKSADNDNCETAGLLMKCLNDGMKKEGFDNL